MDTVAMSTQLIDDLTQRDAVDDDRPSTRVVVMTTTGLVYAGQEVARDALGITLQYVGDDLVTGEILAETTPDEQRVFVPWTAVVSILSAEGGVGWGQSEDWVTAHQELRPRQTLEPGGWFTVETNDGRALTGEGSPEVHGMRLSLGTITDQRGKRLRRQVLVPWASIATVEWSTTLPRQA